MNHLTKELLGENAHVNTLTIFDELEIEYAGVVVLNQHSIWQILNHMIYWQDYILRLLNGGETEPPKHASVTWPTMVIPPTKKDWDLAVNKFAAGINEAVRFAENDEVVSSDQVEHLLTLISHNSYHSGQVVIIRRFLNQWPPTSGGDTW